MKKLVILTMAAIVFAACTNSKKESKPNFEIKQVTAIAETTPVTSMEGEDAADDPAIYVHPTDASKSLVIGTNKKAGLCIYNLQGEEVFFSPVGLVNNVDIRYGFPLNDSINVDLLAASNRSNNSITIMGIDAENKTFFDVLEDTIFSNVDEVYGCCMHKNVSTGKYYAIVNGKDGNVEQWELNATPDSKINAELVKSYKVATQPEGMVADDENNLLYVGEEDRGIWLFNLLSDEEPTLLSLSDTSNPNIKYDVEGITLYKGKSNSEGYVIASSQGNFSFAVFFT
jgi:3-phytase